jgi:hypothetical protein
VQLALAKIGEDDPRREELKRRQRELLKGHEVDWVGPLRELVRYWEFRGGFVEFVSVSVETLLAQAELLVRLAPLQHLSLYFVGMQYLYGKHGNFSRFLETHPNPVEYLNTFPRYVAEKTLALSSLPYLAGLTSLSFLGFMGDAWLQALAASPHLTRLRALHFRNCQISDTDLQAALVASPHLSRLTALEFHDCGISDTGLQALADSPSLTHLTTLILEGEWETGPANDVSDAGIQALASSPHLVGLTTLNLQGCGIYIGDEGARALAMSPYLRRLTTLHLCAGGRLNDETKRIMRARFGDGVNFGPAPF